MKRDTAAKIYEWASYVMLLAATAFFFIARERVSITLIVLMVSIFLRALMYRTRCKAYEEENSDLKRDLRRLTAVLKEKEKSK